MSDGTGHTARHEPTAEMDATEDRADVAMGSRPGSAETPVITVCPKGPLLVRGNVLLAAEPGAEPLPPERKIIALCRCGMTSIAPHCDGSHKLAKVRAFMSGGPQG